MKVFSVYDSKAEAFLPPFFCATRAVGVRIFSSAANDVEHQFSRFAGDFTLFEFGSFDEAVGKFDLADSHENLGTALGYQTSIQGGE